MILDQRGSYVDELFKDRVVRRVFPVDPAHHVRPSSRTLVSSRRESYEGLIEGLVLPRQAEPQRQLTIPVKPSMTSVFL